MIFYITRRVGQFLYKRAGLFRDDIYTERDGLCALPMDDSNKEIARLITDPNPTMSGRLGYGEVTILLNYLEKKEWGKGSKSKKLDLSFRGMRDCWDQNLIDLAYNNGGVYPRSEVIMDELCEIYISSIKAADAMALLGGIDGESNLIRTHGRSPRCLSFRALEPYLSQDPWSKQLRGKNVLVISPFAETIQEQYAKRKELFRDPNVLPDFNLKTLKSEYAIAGKHANHESWIAALKAMQSRMDDIEHDVCLIGAGMFGMPLAQHAKETGRKSVVIGGALQNLFGIRGSRWENYVTDVLPFYNDHWVRVGVVERKDGSAKIEGGCYW